MQRRCAPPASTYKTYCLTSSKILFDIIKDESTLKSQDMSRTKAQPLPSLL